MSILARTLRAASLALAACCASCASTHSGQEQGTDSTTHWLERCDSDVDCGELSCLCGICSASCEDDDACSDFASDARCGQPAVRCSSATAMCVASEQAPGKTQGEPPVQANGKPPSSSLQSDAGAAGTTVVGAPGERDAGARACTHAGFLRGGGRQHLPCVDDCRSTLWLQWSFPDAGPGCSGGLYAVVSVQDSGDAYREHTAQLDLEGWDQAISVSEVLAASGPPDPLCADCSSIDSAWVTIPGSDQFDTELEYPLGVPTLALNDADVFVQSLIDQVDSCTGSLLAECHETTPPVNPDDPGAPQCMIHYLQRSGGMSEVSCAFPADTDTPCRSAVRCLCSTDILEPGHLDQQVCEDSWLATRDAVTFSDFCSQGADNATRTLADALTGFAGAYGDFAEASPECDGLMAFY